MVDAMDPRMLDDFTRDIPTNAETLFTPSLTQVTMLTRILTLVDNVLVEAFNSSGAVFSTIDFPAAAFCRPPPPVQLIYVGMFTENHDHNERVQRDGS